MLRTENECIEYIHSLKKFGKKAGLSNTQRLCEALGNPQDKLKVVHIAGTNGKGSVSAMTCNVLSKKYKVGLYTSPYIEFFNERIQINGEPIDAADLVEYTNKVKDACDSLENFHPIEFEFITAMGFLYFLHKNCDIVILETGLGGRFDATNVVKNPVACAITSIGLDHTAILGDTIEKIAFEKAGIIKKGVPVFVCNDIDMKALSVIENVASEQKSPLFVTDKAENIKCSVSGTDFSYTGNNYHTSLVGHHQAKNACLALSLVNHIKDTFPVSLDDVKKGLSETLWKCRFEILSGNGHFFVLDGAHNSHGIDAFLNCVNSVLNDKRKIFVFAMLNEKDYEESIRKISCVADDIIVTSVPSIRQTDAESIYECVKKYFPKAQYVIDCEKALSLAANSANGDAVCIFGSLYLAGYLRKYCAKMVSSHTTN